MQDFVTIQGQKIAFTRKSIPVEQCRLDPSNPRIQYTLGLRKSVVDENELDQILWAKDSVKALSQSILQNGGVRDPIIVREISENESLVLEGNCRTVSCRHLLEEYPNDIRFKNIPAMVFTDTLSDENLTIMLTCLHVSGKIPWDAYEKAKYVHMLHTKYGKPYEWLAMSMRISKSKIKDLLDAYQAMEDYLKENPNESVKKFSRFAETVKKKELKTRLNDPEFKKIFYGWLRDNKLTENYHIRELPKILENPSALNALNKAGFDAAYTIILKNDPALESYLFSAIKTAIEKLKNASVTEIRDLSNDTKKIAMLQELFTSTKDLATIANVQLI